MKYYNYKPIVEEVKKRKVVQDNLKDHNMSGHHRTEISGNTRSNQVQIFQEERKADGTYIRAMRWVNHQEFVS